MMPFDIASPLHNRLQKVHTEMAELIEWTIVPLASQKINSCMHILVLNNSLFCFQAELLKLSCSEVYSFLKGEIAKKGGFFFINSLA